MEQKERIYFLDYLRAFIILLVIILHIEVGFSIVPFSDWVENREGSLLFTLLFLVTEQPLMTLMFFIAGYFTIPSFVKTGPGSFMKSKIIKLGIPLVVGTLTILPVSNYITQLSKGGTADFFTFLQGYFKLKAFNQYHLWFIDVLLIFFGLTTLFSFFAKDTISLSGIKTVKPSPLFFIGFPAVSIVLMCLAGYFTSYPVWTATILISFQNMRLPIFILFFILGKYAYKRNWFTKDGYSPRPLPWAIVFVLSQIGYLLCFKFFYGDSFHLDGKSTPLLENICVAASYSLGTFSGLLMFLGLFKKYLNFSHPAAGKIASSSYAAYFVHLPVAFYVNYLLIPLALPLMVKFLAITLLSVGFTWGIALAVKKTPVLKRVF